MTDSDEKTIEEVGQEALGEALEGLDMDEIRKSIDKDREESKFEREETEEAGEQILTEEKTPAEAAAIRATKKARVAQILTRGILNEKIQSVFERAVPDGFTGKFVRDDGGDIVRYRNLMFGFTYNEGCEDIQDPDGRIRIGDVVLMTITREDRAILSEVREQQIQHKLGKGKEEYELQMDRERDSSVSPTDDSVEQVQSIRG